MTRLLFINANLLNGTEPAREAMTVAVENHRITAVEHRDNIDPSPEDIVYDLAGKTLMPGMVSGHFHSAYHNLGAEPGLPLLEFPPAYTAFRALANVQIALRAGFTSLVSAGSTYDVDASLEQAIEHGLVEGPRMVPCSRDILTSADNIQPWWVHSPEPCVLHCDGPDAVRRAVRSEIGRGVRMIKLFVSGGHGQGRKGERILAFDEVEAAVLAAHNRGVRVRGHVVGKENILHSIEAGLDTLDHCDGMDEECIEAMVEAGVQVLPSLNLPKKMLDNPMFSFDTSEIQADFDAMCAILPRAAEAGVKLCIGDDYGAAGLPHGSYAEELALYVRHAGVSPLEVIKWATANGGELTGRNDVGRIAPGMLADLIVVDGDPSDDITLLGQPDKLLLIMAGGKPVAGARRTDFTTAA